MEDIVRFCCFFCFVVQVGDMVQFGDFGCFSR